MKQVLIVALAVSLIGLGPVPLSACALASAKLAECATPATRSHCDGMSTAEESGNKVAAVPNGFCCSFSNAPVSTRGQKAPDQVQLTTPVVAVLPVTVGLPRHEADRPADTEPNISPPSQPLLCTFLI